MSELTREPTPAIDMAYVQRVVKPFAAATREEAVNIIMAQVKP